MIIKRILLDNYKTFQYPTEIVFPITSDEKNIFLIGGMNGSGKTSLMEAISICLYGVRKDIIYKSINRKEFLRKNLKITLELEMETDDQDTLVIRRKYSWDDVENPKPNAVIEELSVLKNGSQVSSQTEKIWDEYISSTMPRSIAQFFFFDGEKIQEVASDDHFEVRLKKSFEAALGIKFISQLIQDINKIKHNERQGFNEITDDDLLFKENNLKILQKKHQRLKKERKLIEKEIAEYESERKTIKKRFVLVFDKEPEQRNDEKLKEEWRIKESTRLSKINSEIKTIIEKQLYIAMASSLFKNIEKQIEIESREASKLVLRDSASTVLHASLKALYEPTLLLKSRLSVEKEKEFKERLTDILSKNSRDDNKLLDLTEREVAQILLLIKNTEKSDIHRLEEMLNEKTEITESLNDAKDNDYELLSDSESSLFSQLQEEIESLSVQIGRKKEELNILEENLISIESDIEDEERAVSRLHDSYLLSQEKQVFLDDCNTIVNLLNDYVVKLRKNKIQILKDKTSEMYRLLSNKSDLISKISMDDETYEVIITDLNGATIKKSSLSAGEKEVFAISLLWGLAKASSINLPIIIDTPLSRLDSSHRNSIVKNYFPNSGKQVIILSTDTEIDEKYYKMLESSLSGAGQLYFDKDKERTIYKEEYFWNN
jgi:DNA sulfur modification protein DndD